jgi:cytochrome P450
VNVQAVDIPRVDVDLTDTELHRSGDIFAVWQQLRDKAPVAWHPEGEYPGFWSVARYDDVRAVLRDAESFSSAQGILLRPRAHGLDPGRGRTLALTDQPRHRALRGLVADWFSERAIRQLGPTMEEITNEVIESALARGDVDFVEDIAARLPLYVICHLLGVPVDDREYLWKHTSLAFGASEPAVRSVAHQMIMSYFIDLIEDCRADPGDDLTSVLVHAIIDDEPLPFEDILLNCDNLLVGGTENVRLATASGMLALMQHPEQWNRLVDNPDLIPSAVEEILRWTSSATHIMRTASRPTTIGSIDVAEGERVVVWLPSANRDERAFPDADQFDVGRKPNRQLALGAGPHYCVGVALARAEMRVLLRQLIDLKVTFEQIGPEERLSSIVVSGLSQLPVRLRR